MPSSVYVPAFAGRYVHALGSNCECCEPAPLRSSARGSECLIGSHMRCTSRSDSHSAAGRLICPSQNGKHLPNATSSFGEPFKRMRLVSSAHTRLRSLARKPSQVLLSAVTQRSAELVCPSLTSTVSPWRSDGWDAGEGARGRAVR